ncbi:hypothetical protein JCM16303_007358 [Sporobolomyces ruberrimus]
MAIPPSAISGSSHVNSKKQTSHPSLIDPSLFPDHQQPLLVNTNGPIDSSTIRERERNQLRVVAQGLAPQLVLDQPLSVPTAPPTFRHCLAEDAPLLPISVLRACLNEASTNALFSSATSLDASQEETTRLLNDVDSFQTTVLGLLDEVERRYSAQERRVNGTNGVKRDFEEDDEDNKPSTKVKKYMLHRGGANGGDLFTSAAFLSDRDLEEVSLLHDADLVAVHPPPTSASSSALLASPVPTLGSLHPAYPPPPSTLPISLRYNLAPGQSPQTAPSLPSLIPPSAPRTTPNQLGSSVRETRMLDYGVWSSGLNGPSFDSNGSTDGGYYRSARRSQGKDFVKKWEKGLVKNEPLPRIRIDEEEEENIERGEKEFVLTEEEKKTLGDMEVELEGFLQFTNKVKRDEERVWRVLERNLELIQRLGCAQVARTRKSAKKEERKRRGGKGGAAASRKKEVNGVTVDGEDDVREDERRDLAEGIEKQDADTLLESFTSLLSSFYHSSPLPSLKPGSTTPSRLVPTPSLVRSLTPLIVGELARESSYTGGLEALEGNDVRGWEKAVKEGSGAEGQGMIKQE